MGAHVTNSHIINHTRTEAQELEIKRNDAALIDYFYDKEHLVILEALKSDLSLIKDFVDIKKMKFITFDEFLPAFMRSLMHVYDSAPVLKWTGADDEEDGDEVKEPVYMTKLRKLLKEVDFAQAMRDNLIQCRLHNTVFAEAKYNKDLDKMFIETGYNVGNSFVVEFESFFREWEIFAYEAWRVGDESVWIVWDRKTKEHYKFKTDRALPKFDCEKRLFDGDREPVGDNEDFAAPDYGGSQHPPYVLYRYERQNSFWGNGMIAIVDLIRVIHVLCTITMDDTLLQTMRLLILNFEPKGTEGDYGQLKTGMSHPVTSGNATPGNQVEPQADIVSADLYTEDVLKFIESLFDITANVFEADNPMRSKIETDLSGIALRLRAEPLLRNWSEDIQRVAKPDMETIKALVFVHNLNRPKDQQIDVKVLDEIAMDYQPPSVVKDEIGEYELERKKWTDGISNPVLWVMRLNPEMTQKQATEYIQNNKKITRELRGTTINLQRDADA